MVKMPTLTTKDAVAVGADALNSRKTRCVPCLIAADMCSTSSQFSTLLIYCFSARVAIPVDEDIHVTTWQKLSRRKQLTRCCSDSPVLTRLLMALAYGYIFGIEVW